MDNILVTEHPQGLSAKLADFGFATCLSLTDPHIRHCKGTRRGYMAPEIHRARTEPGESYDGKAADMFALGVVLFALVLGRLPFEYATPTDRHYSLIAEQREEEFKATHCGALEQLRNQDDAMAEEFIELFLGLVSASP